MSGRQSQQKLFIHIINRIVFSFIFSTKKFTKCIESTYLYISFRPNRHEVLLRMTRDMNRVQFYGSKICIFWP